MADASIFRFLYAMAARAPTLAPDQFLKRLATGLANHYGAEGCAIYTDSSGWSATAADPAPALASMSRLDRARLETIEARVVSLAHENGRMVSALDLDETPDVEAFLARTLGVADVFGFPLQKEEGDADLYVVVIYLGEDAQPFRDPDMYAMSSLGGLIALAGHAVED